MIMAISDHNVSQYISSVFNLLNIKTRLPKVDTSNINVPKHLCLGPIGDFCIGDGEMYNYTRDASRCVAILSINTSSFDEKN